MKLGDDSISEEKVRHSSSNVTAWDLLVTLFDRGFHLIEEKGTLKVRSLTQKKLTSDDLQLIRSLKKDLIDLVREPQAISSNLFRNEEKQFPLSSSQQRTWDIENVFGYSTPTITAIVRIEGNLDTKCLELAFLRLIWNHSILRTKYREVGNKVVQEIIDKDKYSLPSIVIKKTGCDDIRGYAEKFFSQKMNLKIGENIQGELIPSCDNENYLVIKVHHIAADAYSMDILQEELMGNYRYFWHKEHSNIDVPAPTSEFQYLDYVCWEQEFLKNANKDKLIDYWKTAINPNFGWRELVDKKVDNLNEKGSDLVSLNFGEKKRQQLFTMSRKYGVTMKALVLAIVSLVSDEEFIPINEKAERGINIGIPYSGRNLHQFSKVVGLFANTLIFSIRTDRENNTFSSFVKECQNVLLNNSLNQKLPFQDIIKCLDVNSGNRIYQISFNMKSEQPEKYDFELLDISNDLKKVSPGYFDLRINVVDKLDSLNFQFAFDLEKLSKSYIVSYVNKVEKLVNKCTGGVIHNLQDDIFA